MILLSRENFLLDDRLISRLVSHFAGGNQTIIRYESQMAVTTRLVERRCFACLPRPGRQWLKALLLLFLPVHWRHFSPRYRAEANSVTYRVRSLLDLIAFLGPGKEIVLLTRSAGGRASSLVADQVGIRKLICLGYPFRSPGGPLEPERYAHLETLRTPFLIIQGTRDAYGGRDTAGEYLLARDTVIRWVETDHNFSVPDREWDTIFELVDNFLLQDGRPGEVMNEQMTSV